MSDAPPGGWGQTPGGHGQPPHGQPPQSPQGYGVGFGPPGAPVPSYGAPPPKRDNGPVIAIIVVLVILVVVVGGGIAALLLFRADDGAASVAADAPIRTDGSPLTPEPLPPPAGSDESAADTDQSVFELPVGTCFDDPGNAEEIEEVTAVSCDAPHDNEVFALVDYAAGEDEPFPGSEAVSVFGQEQCQGPLFDDYVGMTYLDSQYYTTQLTPTEGSWAQGDREIVCLLFDPEAQITGSVRGSAR